MEYRPNDDIFETGADVLVNPVNCQVHLLYDRHRAKPEKYPTAQEGLAKGFELRYPGAQPALEDVCRDGNMRPGMVMFVGVNRETGEKAEKGKADRLIANVSTKDHWRDPSKLEWVDEGLRKLAGAIETRGIKSVAIPMLGAGFGKLAWGDVRPLIERHFKPLAQKGVKVMVMGEGPKRELEQGAADKAAKASAANAGTGGQADARELASGGQATWSQDTKFYAGIGARDTPESVQKKMVQVGKLLAKAGLVLRSGAADGADSAFERGCDEADNTRKEIFLPWDGFDPKRDGNKRYANGRTVFSDEPTQGHVDLARKYHPHYDTMKSGAKNLHARNGSQMFGRNLDRPTNVVICWTENGEPKRGTGQAIRIAEDNGIDVINLGDERFKKLPAESIAKIAVSVAEGKPLGKALTAEKMRRKREEAVEL